jgi:hypothetical protein
VSLPFDRNAANLFIQYMYAGQPGWINICHVDYAGGKLKPGRFFEVAQGLDAVVEYAQWLADRHTQSIYIRTTTMKNMPYSGRGLSTDTLACSYGWSDLDHGTDGHKGENLPPTPEAAFALVEEAGLPEPTLWIHSGGGWYPTWKWSRPLTVEESKELVGRIQDHLLLASNKHGWRHDSGVRDMARVLRLVGSSNMKTGRPRPCRIAGGTGRPVDPEAFPPAVPREVVRRADPKAVPPPKKATAPYRVTGRRGPWDVFDELVDWPEILEQYGLTHVGSDSISELYVRDGASSTYSLKVMHASDCVVNHSEALDLPVRVGLTKAAFLAYMEGFGGDRGELLRAVFSGEKTAGIAPDVIDAMRSGGVTVVHLKRGEVPTPQQFMAGAHVMYVDEPQVSEPKVSADLHQVGPITDQDVDDYLRTFTRYTRPRALTNREQWMRSDGLPGLRRHAAWLVHESMLGYYPSEHAVRALVAACSPHGVDPKSTLKAALGAVLAPRVCA